MCCRRYCLFYEHKVEVKCKILFTRRKLKRLTGINMTQMLSRTLLPMFTQSEKDPIPFLPFPFLNPHIHFLHLCHVVRFRMESTIKFAFFQNLYLPLSLSKAPKTANHSSYLLRQCTDNHKANGNSFRNKLFNVH